MDDLQASALSLSKGMAPTAANLSRIGQATSAAAASWAFTQWALRERARAKFSRSAHMLFTRHGLEMATGEALANYHASRFPTGELVFDLTCGIGGDLIALARRGPAVGIETDPEVASYARHNLGVYDVEAEVRQAEALEVARDLGPAYAFADPSRRANGRRLARPDDFSPSPLQLIDALAWTQALGMKLSAMIPDQVLEGLGRRLEFVSFAGECREALVWSGESVEPGRKAILVRSACQPLELDAGTHSEVVDRAASWLFEADPAAIRAHALANFGLEGLGDSNGYLTGDRLLNSPWLRAYEVVEDGPWRPESISAALAHLGGRLVAVKTRVRGVEPKREARRVRDGGEMPFALVLYPVGRKTRAALVRPHSAEPPGDIPQ